MTTILIVAFWYGTIIKLSAAFHKTLLQIADYRPNTRLLTFCYARFTSARVGTTFS